MNLDLISMLPCGSGFLTTSSRMKRGNRDVVQQMSAENTMNGTCVQLRSFKERGNKTNINDHNETIETSGTYNKERELGEYITYRRLKSRQRV